VVYKYCIIIILQFW